MQRPFALPGARARYTPDRLVAVEHYRIELDVQVPERMIEGSCAITVTAIQDEVRTVELDAVDLNVRSVTSGAAAADFSYDGKRLRIGLAAPLVAGQRTTLVIEYSARPRRGLYFVGPDDAHPNRRHQVWSQGQDEDSRHWFPCFDTPNEKSTSELIATVPDTWFALSNGALVSVSPDASRGTSRFHWRFDVRHSCYLITLAAGELSEIAERWEGVDVSYYVEPGREDDARRALGRTPEMLACFSERFGLRYPYTKYAQVCVSEFIFGGMENTTATTLTDTVLFDARAALDFDNEALVAHELAHQWFGDLVTCRDWGQGWLNEGFATYSEYIWREWGHGRDEAFIELLDWADQYFGEDSKRYRRAVATNVYDEPIDIFDHHLYEKGGLVLHMLRTIVGDQPFWRTLAHYIQKHRTSVVETRDLARAVEETTGRNLDWFFEQWIHKAGHPELKVEYSHDADQRLARFAVRQTQKVEGETPLFRLPLKVRFRIGDRDVILPLEVKEANEVFFFPVEEAPTQAIFDTGQPTLKKADVDKPRPLWLAELAGATEAADRIAAAKALVKHTSDDAVAALDRALGSDPFWGVRAAAADTLGQHRSSAARDALARALGEPLHPRARRAVVKALGSFRYDEIAAAALEAVVRAGDPSYFVEAEACLALGRTRSPRAPEALRAALTRDSHLDVIRQNIYKGLAEVRDDTAIPLLLDATRYGRVSQGRRAAIHALASLTIGRNDREARNIRERIEELLFDPDFRVQQTALEGLHTIADAKAGPAIRRAVDTNLDGRIRRRGKEVLRDLEEGRNRDDATRALRDEVERLRQELAGLRERLQRVEAAPGTAATQRGDGASAASTTPRPSSRKQKVIPAKKRGTLAKARPRRPHR
jgi:aminopeptidase N